MENAAEVNCIEDRKRGSQIMDPSRRKVLMKKLAKIKLNRSRGNNSFNDLTTFYESKIRKLRSNNICLAKALADQRIVSQSWYDEVVSMKVELHESREDLLRYRVNESSSYEAAIYSAAERRIKDFAEPLETALSEAFQNVYSLVETMTNVKKIVSTLLKSSNEKVNYSRSSHGSSGSRPPLCRTPKSPRKNVVHPMVEGHVLQPASIHIPRMSLEERRKYRLQERAEDHDHEMMSVIGEQSISLAEGSEESLAEIPTEEMSEPSEPSDIVAAESGSHDTDSPIATTPEPVQTRSVSPPELQSTSPREEKQPLELLNTSHPAVSPSRAWVSPSPELTRDELPQEPRTSSSLPVKNNRRSQPVIDNEDPLEGSSWMHTKRRRGSKKRKKSRPSGPALKRTSGMHILLDSSSDSEGEIYPVTQKKHKVNKTPVFKASSNGVSKAFPKESPEPKQNSKDSAKQKRKNHSSEAGERETSGAVDPENVNRTSVAIEEANVPRTSVSEEPNSNDKPCHLIQPLNSSLPAISPSRLEALENRISRRSKKHSNSLTNGNVRNSKTVTDSAPLEEVSRCLSRNTFETFSNGLDFSPLLHSDDSESIPLPEAERTLLTAEITTPSPCNLNIMPEEDSHKKGGVNETCLLDASMEITNCLAKDLLKGSPYNASQVVNCFNTEPSRNVEAKNEDKVSIPTEEKRKNNFFFKCSGKEIPINSKTPEKTPYDLSMLETSVVGPYPFTKGKENIPPDNQEETSITEPGMKLRDVSIVVKDIMKTSPLAQERSGSKEAEPKELNLNLKETVETKPVTVTRPPSKRQKKKTQKVLESPEKNSKEKKKSAVKDPTPVVVLEKEESSNSELETEGKRKKGFRKTRLAQVKESSLNGRASSRMSPDCESVSQSSLSDGDSCHMKIAPSTMHNGGPHSLEEEKDLNFDDGYPDFTKLLQIEISVDKDKEVELDDIEELDPLSFSPISEKQKRRDSPEPVSEEEEEEENEEDDIQVIAVVSSPVYNGHSVTEGVKARPRRAASKFACLAEPRLNQKMRQDVFGKKPYKSKRKSKR